MSQFSVSAGVDMALGNGPPCRSYRTLQCLSDFKGMVTDLGQCRTKEAVLAVMATLKAPKAAYTDLITMSNVACSRITTSYEARKKELEVVAASTKLAKRARTTVSTPTKETLLCSSSAVELVIDVPSIVLRDGVATKPPDLEEPVVFRVEESRMVTLSLITDQITSLGGSKFTDHVDYSKFGRQHFKLLEAGTAALAPVVKEVFPAKLDAPNGHEVTVRPCLVLHAKDRVACGTEFAYVAHARLGLKGTRKLFLTKFMPLQKFLAAQQGTRPVLRKDVLNWFKNSSPAEVQKFLKENPTEHRVFQATVGPNDLIYLPPAYIFLEKIGGVDAASIRIPILLKEHADDLDELSKLLLQQNSMPDLLQAAVDMLNVAG